MERRREAARPLPADPVQRFWAWFQLNGERLRDPASLDHEAVQQLGEMLGAVHPGLVYEFTVRDGRSIEMAISADGRRELFGKVLEVVDAAPAMSGWTVTPFRQPGPLDLRIQIAGMTLGPDDVWFRIIRDGPRTGIAAFVHGLCADNQDVVGEALFVLLDNALGEFAMATAVDFIQVRPLPADPSRLGLLPFPELPSHVRPVMQ